jgi:hypothetical protein
MQSGEGAGTYWGFLLALVGAVLSMGVPLAPSPLTLQPFPRRYARVESP